MKKCTPIWRNWHDETQRTSPFSSSWGILGRRAWFGFVGGCAHGPWRAATVMYGLIWTVQWAKTSQTTRTHLWFALDFILFKESVNNWGENDCMLGQPQNIYPSAGHLPRCGLVGSNSLLPRHWWFCRWISVPALSWSRGWGLSLHPWGQGKIPEPFWEISIDAHLSILCKNSGRDCVLGLCHHSGKSATG